MWEELTRDTEQQLSRGKGSFSPAETTEVQRIWRSLSVPPGMVTAGKPNTVCCQVVGGSSTSEGSLEGGIPTIRDSDGAVL